MFRNKLYVYGSDDIYVPADLHFGKEIFKRILSYKDRVAVINAETKEQLTYAELGQQIANVAVSLTRMGVRKGDFVSVCSEKSMEFWPMVIGIMCSGATFVAADITCGSATVLHRINITKPRFIFCSELAYSLHGKLFGDKCVRLKDFKREEVSLEEFLPVPVEGHKDNMLVFFSSGTTGLPKGIPMTHWGLMINLLSGAGKDNYYAGNTMLCTREWYYSYGLMHTLGCILAGTTIVYCPAETEQEYIKTIQEYKVSVLQIVPTTIARLVKSSILEKYDVSSIKYVVSASTPLEAELMDVFKRKFPNIKQINQIYGLSEGGYVCSDVHGSKGPKLGSVGPPCPTFVIKVLDIDTRETLGPHQRGEICFKSLSMTKGYLNASNDGTHDEEGFFQTGDIGYYDEDGYFFIVNRIKELIKYNSYQVAPAELEAVLLQHPSVKDAAVLGVPHPDWGEAPTGLVVLQPGATTTAEEVTEFVNSQVSFRMCLAGGVKFIEQLPYGAGAKLDRKALKNIKF